MTKFLEKHLFLAVLDLFYPFSGKKEFSLKIELCRFLDFIIIYNP